MTLRIKEEWSDEVTTNLYTAVSRKEYFLEKGSYSYFYLNPDVAWEITDRIKWYTGFRSKWTFYDELDSEGNPKNFTSLLAKTNLTFKPIEKLIIIPSFQGVFDLYQNQAKTQRLPTPSVSASLPQSIMSVWEESTRASCVSRWGSRAQSLSGLIMSSE